jgi:hypothetical protein
MGTQEIIASWITNFLVAFGVVLGGSLLGGVGAVLSLQAPAVVMQLLAERIKIWALVVAIGGTIDPLRELESNVLEGHLSPVILQVLSILFAFLGAHMATSLVMWICRGGDVP